MSLGKEVRASLSRSRVTTTGLRVRHFGAGWRWAVWVVCRESSWRGFWDKLTHGNRKDFFEEFRGNF